MADVRQLKSVGKPGTGKPKPKVPAKADPVLEGRALELFSALKGPLEGSGRLKPEFVPVFRLLCQTLAVAEAAGSKLSGVETEGRSDKKVADPAWRGFRDASVLATQIAREFGLTPASAATVKVGATADDDEVRELLA